jgi:protein phosphatase
VLPDEELARLLGDGTPDYAALTQVNAALDAGSTDNVTVVVADLVADDAVEDAETSAAAVIGPMVVGAAAEASRRRGIGSGKAARAADTGELEPVPGNGGGGGGSGVDPEEARYAPRAPRRFIWARRVGALGLVCVLVAIVAIAGYKWTQSQYYVANDGNTVSIFRGIEADLPGVRMHRVEETSALKLDDLPTYNARQVRDGISANSLEDARGIITRLKRLAVCPEPKPQPSATPKASPTAKATTKAQKQAQAEAKKKAEARARKRASASPSPSPSPSPGSTTLCTEAP